MGTCCGGLAVGGKVRSSRAGARSVTPATCPRSRAATSRFSSGPRPGLGSGAPGHRCGRGSSRTRPSRISQHPRAGRDDLMSWRRRHHDRRRTGPCNNRRPRRSHSRRPSPSRRPRCPRSRKGYPRSPGRQSRKACGRTGQGSCSTHRYEDDRRPCFELYANTPAETSRRQACTPEVVRSGRWLRPANVPYGHEAKNAGPRSVRAAHRAWPPPKTRLARHSGRAPW